MFHIVNYTIEFGMLRTKYCIIILCVIILFLCSDSSWSSDSLNSFQTLTKKEKAAFVKKMIVEKKYCESTLYCINELKQDPYNDEIRLLYCIALNKMGEFYSTVLVLSDREMKQKRDYYIILAESQFITGDISSLDATAQRMKQYFPHSSDAYALTGAVYALKAQQSDSVWYQMKYVKKSKKYLEKCLEIDNNNWYANTILGVLSSAMSQQDNAQRYFQKVDLKNGYPLHEYDVFRSFFKERT